MSDSSFFAGLGEFLEDEYPEQLLNNQMMIQRIYNTMISDNVKANFNILSFLRGWCRKMHFRIVLEDDERISTHDNQELAQKIHKLCLKFALASSKFFDAMELLPLACVTCKELLKLAQIPSPPPIIEMALKYCHINRLKVPLLDLISNAECIIDDLPVLDPTIFYEYPILYKQLLNISTPPAKQEAIEFQKLINKIKSINNLQIPIDRNILQFCTVDQLIGTAPEDLFATHADESVRKIFYRHAVLNKTEIIQFVDALLSKGLFDETVKKYAYELLKTQFGSLKSINLSHKHIAYLQCIDMRERDPIFEEIKEVILLNNDHTVLCSWLRNLYHKQKWIRERSLEIIQDIVPFQLKLDLNEQAFEDPYIVLYNKYLAKTVDCIDDPLSISLFETVTSQEQADFIKTIAADKLIEIILDPAQNIKQCLHMIRDLPFSKYPKLMHALAIRDGNWKITDVKRIFELLYSLNEENSLHLLPVLSRIVFEPLIQNENNGSNLMKIPNFLAKWFTIRGSTASHEPIYYEPIALPEHEDLIPQWVYYETERQIPIRDGFSISTLTSLVVCDPLLAADILYQIDENDAAAEKLMISASPSIVLYLLLLSVLSAKMSSTAAAWICQKLLPKAPSMGLKLSQALIEFGGDFQVPEQINEYIREPGTRRDALSLIVTLRHFKKNVDYLDIELLTHLAGHKQPLNISRQIKAILSSYKVENLDIIDEDDRLNKALAYHMTDLNESLIDYAIKSVFDDQEPICVRATALESIISYIEKGNEVRVKFNSLLFETNENMLSLQILRLLSIRAIRSDVEEFESYVLHFLEKSKNSLFINTALASLVGYNITKIEIANCLSKLTKCKDYATNIIIILSHLSNESLRLFDSDMIITIAFALGEVNLLTELVVINHMIIAGIEFPPVAMEALIDNYDSFSDTTPLHEVLKQIFSISYDSKCVALENGFLTYARTELKNYRTVKWKYDMILQTCAMFIYRFPSGQDALIEEWGIDTIYSIFSTSNVSLHFMLCLTINNPKSQAIFAEQYNQMSLVDKIFEIFDCNRIVNPSILKLISSIINSEKIRNVFYKKRIIQKMVPRLTYAANNKEWELAQGMLEIFISLTKYQDGCEELFDKVKIIEVFVNLLSNEKITNMPLFHALISNIRSFPVPNKVLDRSIRSSSRSIFEKYASIIKMSSKHELNS